MHPCKNIEANQPMPVGQENTEELQIFVVMYFSRKMGVTWVVLGKIKPGDSQDPERWR